MRHALAGADGSARQKAFKPRAARRGVDAQVIVIGAGAVGTSTAFHLARAGHDVLVLEQAEGPAKHQSGRNSGVIHAGYNVKPGSKKAAYCHDGNRRLRAYCDENSIAVLEGGILVVARNEAEQSTLRELKRRADQNHVEASILDAGEMHALEPHAAGVAALHAPEACSFDAVGYVQRLEQDARDQGARFRYGVRAHRVRGGRVVTDQGQLEGQVVVNAAGLWADRLARHTRKDLRVIPFRGYYAELRPDATQRVRSHIYAAPDLRFPFLGVHLSRRFDGRVIVGPGAMLALARDAYRFWQARPRDLAETALWPGFWRLMMRPEMRSMVVSEVHKSLALGAIAREAARLVPTIRRKDLVRSFAGNRAQLVDRQGNLVDDIVVHEAPQQVHVLNAVSPGLTCSLPFGEDLAKRAAAMT